jgi:methionine aminopeptidase
MSARHPFVSLGETIEERAKNQKFKVKKAMRHKNTMRTNKGEYRTPVPKDKWVRSHITLTKMY